MKNKIIILCLLSGLGLTPGLYAQTSVEINGTVKSSQGAVQGAQIDFMDMSDNFISNSISGPNGTFKSDTKFAVAKNIKTRISKYGYETLVKVIKTDKTGDAGEFMLTAKKLIISGFVKDSVTEQALPGVQISFYDAQGKLIQARSTNSIGYFDLETDFIYGQKITVRQSKKDYYDKEQTLTFASDGMNRLQDIMLPEIAARGLRAFVQIRDKKTQKLLGGGTIRYFDKRKSTYLDNLFSATNKLEFKIYQRPGTTFDLEVAKPNYRPIHAQPTLSEDPLKNTFEYVLEKDGQSAVGPVLLISSGVTAMLSGGMYLSSTKKYDSYKDFGNSNREKDFNSAEQARTISAVAGGVAAAALIGYIITRVSHKNKIKAQERKLIKTSAFRFEPAKQYYAMGTPIINLTYHF